MQKVKLCFIIIKEYAGGSLSGRMLLSNMWEAITTYFTSFPLIVFWKNAHRMEDRSRDKL
jgi:hypothetical protein